MAENEFEKNVRREMDEFKLHPTADVWPKIEERIREKNRKRRILFFVLFSFIALVLVGYGIYNFSGTNREAALHRELSNDDRQNDKNKIDKSQNKESNKETITIKPNIPADIKEPEKILTSTKQKRPNQSDTEQKQVTSITKRNPGSQKEDLAIQNTNPKEQKNDIAVDTATPGKADISSLTQRPIITDYNQNEITQGDKNLPIDNTAPKLEESKDTKTVQVVNKKKGDKVSGKITWGINFSAGSSVITEDAFSFKSSYATADMAYSVPGSSTGGGPVTGGGGGTVTYYRWRL